MSSISDAALAAAHSTAVDVAGNYSRSSSRERDAIHVADRVIFALQAFGVAKGDGVPVGRVNDLTVPANGLEGNSLQCLGQAQELAMHIARFEIPTHFASSGGARTTAAEEIALTVLHSLYVNGELNLTRREFLADVLLGTYPNASDDLLDQIEALLDAPVDRSGTSTVSQVEDLLRSKFSDTLSVTANTMAAQIVSSRIVRFGL